MLTQPGNAGGQVAWLGGRLPLALEARRLFRLNSSIAAKGCFLEMPGIETGRGKMLVLSPLSLSLFPPPLQDFGGGIGNEPHAFLLRLLPGRAFAPDPAAGTPRPCASHPDRPRRHSARPGGRNLQALRPLPQKAAGITLTPITLWGRPDATQKGPLEQRTPSVPALVSVLLPLDTPPPHQAARTMGA